MFSLDADLHNSGMFANASLPGLHLPTRMTMIAAATAHRTDGGACKPACDGPAYSQLSLLTKDEPS
ncbi:hypothetical protein ABU113_14125 [Sphingosinicellaceae bacterium M-36]